MDNTLSHEDFAGVELRLLRGPIYHDDSLWSDLQQYSAPIARHLAQIGLVLHIDEEDGFAYVGQKDSEDADSLPRLVRRRALNSDVSLLCVVLREEWEKDRSSFDGGERCYRSESDLSSILSVLFPEHTDESKTENRFVGLLQKGKELGLLREATRRGEDGERLFEVMPIIKAMVTPDFVEEFKQALENKKAEKDG
ncbi:MAG: DUF4194 domain-containing protein [Spirochaetaceae bacterium]|nr:DUF4194 domain-containing protein [Spirochaetaceae bacterium]MDT8298354.1 DUF4194 domain-containing protein [Spirochaetaceae bacterium]